MKYVVCKKGVYLHDVYGPYDTPADAVARADGLAQKDVDAHHWWVVRSLDTVHGLGDEAIHTVRKPDCRRCGAPPLPAVGPYDILELCPCGVKE